MDKFNTRIRRSQNEINQNSTGTSTSTLEIVVSNRLNRPSNNIGHIQEETGEVADTFTSDKIKNKSLRLSFKKGVFIEGRKRVKEILIYQDFLKFMLAQLLNGLIIQFLK